VERHPESLPVNGLRTLLLALGLGLAAPLPAAPTEVDPALRELLRTAANQSDSFADRFDAVVWLTDMSRRLERKLPDANFRVELLKHAHYEARRAGLQPELVLAVIQIESNFDPYAISSAGARGLMQIMPFWLKEIGRPGDNLFNLHTNLRYGCTILKYYLDKERGDRARALSRYNGTREMRYANSVFQMFYGPWRPQ
jgi:soluble lytic murein transglycosylase-like protein